jgi:hypothetical protein
LGYLFYRILNYKNDGYNPASEIYNGESGLGIGSNGSGLSGGSGHN